MGRSSTRAEAVSYGGTTPKLRRERFTLEEFCKRMRTKHKASFRTVPIRDALRRELVMTECGATVDGVLRTSRGFVAVELLGYSPLRDRGDVMARDLGLRQKITRAISNQLTAKRFSLSLDYRERPRRDGESGKSRTVPSQQDFRKVIDELRKIVSEAPALQSNHFLSVRFVTAGIAEKRGTGAGTLHLDATRFPLCAEHLTRVRLQGLNDDVEPAVDSELIGGPIGLDVAWVKDNVVCKAKKSLDRSRERANGLPLWLIVHSDGQATHQTIPKLHRRRAVEVCREALKTTNHGFARVYWADRTGFFDAAWVGRVPCPRRSRELSLRYSRSTSAETEPPTPPMKEPPGCSPNGL